MFNQGSFSYILLLLGNRKSFVILRTSLYRGSLYWGSTVALKVHHLHVHIHLLSSSSRVVTKILSCRVNTTRKRGIKQLGISFSSIFPLFSNKSSQGPHSYYPGEIPSPWLLMTALIITVDNHNSIGKPKWHNRAAWTQL